MKWNGILIFNEFSLMGLGSFTMLIDVDYYRDSVFIAVIDLGIL